MPCHLFTFHAYRTWMPDRARGYVRRRMGVLPQDVQMARVYEKNANHEAVAHIDCRLHFVATGASHIHVLVSWNGSRDWKENRTSLKRAITIGLKQQFGMRPWLSEGASRKRVREDTHFNYLVGKYLPSQKGWKWDERRGLFK